MNPTTTEHKGFQVSASVKTGRTYSCFGRDPRTGFKVGRVKEMYADSEDAAIKLFIIWAMKWESCGKGDITNIRTAPITRIDWNDEYRIDRSTGELRRKPRGASRVSHITTQQSDRDAENHYAKQYYGHEEY